ncbi:hypothetical protein [Sphingomicrobium astaxanthinifaciens]|uniref:hypothetical protein n=1 Tax=Sphingomicrobium astaxanthinifaciens TaxID=1227949 RepID=UPI001FCB8A82|nr:hypothetical protein [Sphingomicrobium astaxanthinifaciens]MCJ7421738.1 hypothetical protein [Sphingomicrobium astaxanthinifaciens]
MTRVRTCLAALAALALAEPALACSIDELPIPRLPLESEAEHRARVERIGDNDTLLMAYRQQLSAFERADDVWIGRITRSAPWTEMHYPPSDARRATIAPLVRVKGALPGAPVTLEAYWSGGMCTPGGDGAGALAAVGELVVVMRAPGKAREGAANAPSYTSFEARQVVLEELLRALDRLLSRPAEVGEPAR